MNFSRTANYVAFPVLVVATLWGHSWLWGLVFLWWLVPTVMSGQAHLLTEISRDEDPILFWAVAALWALLGLMMIAAALFPQYAPWLI